MMKYMMLANVVLIGDDHKTAAARHLPEGTKWEDHLSGDGSRTLTIVHGDLPVPVVAALVIDTDIIEMLAIPDGAIEPERLELVHSGAARFGIPNDALPDVPNGEDVLTAAKRRMTLSQITLDKDLAEVEQIETEMAHNLRQAGFDPNDIKPSAARDRIKRVQKKKKKP